MAGENQPAEPLQITGETTWLTGSYVYDFRGNRIKENDVQRWAYDEANVLLSIDGASVTTDAAGNMTVKPITSGALSMDYDKQNQMTQATQGSQTLTNLYDATGKRVRKVEGNKETIYVYMGNDVVYKRTADVVLNPQTNVTETMYASVAGRRMRKRTDRAIQYLITDHGAWREVHGEDAGCHWIVLLRGPLL